MGKADSGRNGAGARDRHRAPDRFRVQEMTVSKPSLLQRWMSYAGSTPQRARANLYGLVALAIVIASAMAIGALVVSHQQAQSRADAKTQTLATSLELTFDGMLDATAAQLRPRADEIGRLVAADNATDKTVARLLGVDGLRIPNVSALRVYDEDGDIVAGRDTPGAAANVAARDYFLRARQDEEAQLHVAQASPNRNYDQWYWPLVQRINEPDGSFGGILVATLKVDDLRAMLARIQLEGGDSIELRDPSMGLIARVVFDQANTIQVGDPRMSVPGLEAMREDPRQGTYVSDDSYIDPMSRTYSYRRSARYGYYVVVGVPQTTAFAAWQRQAWLVLALLGAFIACAGVFTWVIDSGWRRHEQALERIRNSENSLNEAMEIARLGSFVYYLRRDTWESSEAFDHMFGIDEHYPRDLVHWLKLVSVDSRHEVRSRVNRLIDKGASFDHEYRIVRPIDGQERWVHSACRLRHDKLGNPVAIVGTYQDITERKAAEETINKLAFFDQLTGLANRTLLLDRLRQAMALSSRSGHAGAVLLIDLDNFKTLNDIHGHEKGDQLLKQVAQRLNSCLRAEDTVSRPLNKNTVARLGGDEFVVVLPNLSGETEEDAAAQAKIVASKLLFALSENYELDGVSFVGTASIGVTLFHGRRASIEDLLKQADLAMYRAKASGRDAVCFFDADLEATVLKRAMLEGHLRQALGLNQFQLHFQAQVVGDGHVTGAEVLARWKHPVLGMVSPAEFIPVAEESNLILPLGRWVLETACRQLAAWSLVPEFLDLTLAVNVSPQQFYQTDFVEQVQGILADTRARPHLLKLELTESLLLRDVDEIIEKMMALKAIGVGFALDDFGTGYSSLLYLKRLPLDQLKIDQSFVRDVLVDPNDAAIARTVAALGQTLGLKVIAEGVETEAQRDFLADSGCHAYQGYFISRPLPVEGFEAFAREAWERENREFLAQCAAAMES
jgi:diguanylate cyclase (GGDEF)-like protein/PAS domain S-box-containing protein